MKFLSICCQGHGKRRVFAVDRFAANLSSLCAHADQVQSVVPPTLLDLPICQLKDIALGGCYLKKCNCCNQRVLRRTHADCRQSRRFDEMLDQLSQSSAVESECEPGNDALPSAWLVKSSKMRHLRLLWQAHDNKISFAQRLRALNDEFDQSRCSDCLVILRIKLIVLLLLLDECACRRAVEQSKTTSVPKLTSQKQCLRHRQQKEKMQKKIKRIRSMKSEKTVGKEAKMTDPIVLPCMPSPSTIIDQDVEKKHQRIQSMKKWHVVGEKATVEKQTFVEWTKQSTNEAKQSFLFAHLDCDDRPCVHACIGAQCMRECHFDVHHKQPFALPDLLHDYRWWRRKDSCTALSNETKQQQHSFLFAHLDCDGHPCVHACIGAQCLRDCHQQCDVHHNQPFSLPDLLRDYRDQ